jgi:transposase-like protein
LTVVENHAPKTGAKSQGSRRPRVSSDEKREIARLYADPSVSTSAICAQLGIGESTLYRIVQEQGIPLRGRAASTRAPARRGRSVRRTSAAAPRASASAASTSRPAGTRNRFRVRYVSERVFEARTIQEALRQANALGATEIVVVEREHR